MIRKRKKFKKFNLDDQKDLSEYEALVNNRFVTITDRDKIIETIKFYNDQGVLTRSEDQVHYLIHWEEKVL